MNLLWLLSHILHFAEFRAYPLKNPRLERGGKRRFDVRCRQAGIYGGFLLKKNWKYFGFLICFFFLFSFCNSLQSRPKACEGYCLRACLHVGMAFAGDYLWHHRMLPAPLAMGSCRNPADHACSYRGTWSMEDRKTCRFWHQVAEGEKTSEDLFTN